MSTNSFRTFSKGIVLLGELTDPSDNIEGSLSVNSTSNRLKTYVQAAIRELITADQTQTLTNKTIDADSNTITNIENADIKAGAAIDATKIADGSVTSTEFQFINSLTSNAQTQINGKISASSTDVLTNKTIDGDDNTIQDLALTSLKTNLTDASKFLVRDASGVVVSNTKAVPTGVVVGTTDSQTLTNKVLSGNTAATLISGSGTLALNTTGTITVPNATDTLVAKTTTDTLTNKTLTTPEISDKILFDQIATPSSPASTKNYLYFKSDDKLYKKNSAGSESEVGSSIPNLVVQTKTTTYTVLSTDDVILASTGAAWTLTFYTPVGNSGKVVKVKKTSLDFNQLTLATAAGNFFENGGTTATTTINTIDEELCAISDGTNWHILSRKSDVMEQAFTPTGTWTSNTTYTGFWSRKGGKMVGEILVSVSGAPTAATLTVNIPSGTSIDNNRLTSQANFESIGGISYVGDGGVQKYTISQVEVATTTSLRPSYDNGTSGKTNVTATAPMTFASGDEVKINFEVPIANWKA